ncbi:MAG: ABC transporter substrate-binding protein, partial [Candidatus Thorarchaeota archaeon]
RYALLITLALVIVSFSGVPSVHGFMESESLVSGPYVDEVIFKVMNYFEQEVLDLQAGELEMAFVLSDRDRLQILESDPEIDIYRAAGDHYGYITINCRDYPLNISGLRRAFAFAFDKGRAAEDLLAGESIDHDSLVHPKSGWCVEDEFEWHYYTSQTDIGNQLLDELGFNISSTTGYRLAPNGEEFEIIFSNVCNSWADKVSRIAVDALHSLCIDSSREYGLESVLDQHGEYDMVFDSNYFYDNDVDWLAYDYWSEYADEPYQNPTNFANESYDIWRNQLLYGATYEEVFEAASEMQKILHYNVPQLVVYAQMSTQAYRNDQFEGHIEDRSRLISGPWTLRNIHKIDGTFGGTVPVSLAREPDTFNIFTTNSYWSKTILENLWPSLYDYGPDMQPVPNLAESMVIETHSDNPSVPDGHRRYTFDIIQNATWSDGTPLTAEDVAFSFNYDVERTYNETFIAPSFAGEIAAAYAPTPYQAVIECNTVSYWHFSDVGYHYIIPKHIFNNDTGIGYEDWKNWNPFLDPSEPYTHCGPFIFSDFEIGEYYSIERNPLFYYSAYPSDNPANTSSTTTSNQTTASFPLIWSYAISIPLGIGSAVTIIYCVVTVIRTRKEELNP